MKIRMGVDRQRLIDEARKIKAPILISANSLRRKNAWRLPDTAGTDLAIDSGGFVAAMNGGFAFHYTNHRPEWAKANIKKGTKSVTHQPELLLNAS